MQSERTPQQVYDQLTPAQRMTLASVRVEGVLTIWRIGAHRRTINALREAGLMRPAAQGGLTPLGEAVQAIAWANGYTALPATQGRVGASINSFKAVSPAKGGERG